MNHIGDVNKLVSDTPRTDKAWKTTHSVYEFTVEMKRMERELNAANDRIMLLETAILSTLNQHRNLADGTDCTLAALKKAMPEWV